MKEKHLWKMSYFENVLRKENLEKLLWKLCLIFDFYVRKDYLKNWLYGMLYLSNPMTLRCWKKELQGKIWSITTHLLINLDITWLKQKKDSIIILVIYGYLFFNIYNSILFLSKSSVSSSFLVLYIIHHFGYNTLIFYSKP